MFSCRNSGMRVGIKGGCVGSGCLNDLRRFSPRFRFCLHIPWVARSRPSSFLSFVQQATQSTHIQSLSLFVLVMFDLKQLSATTLLALVASPLSSMAAPTFNRRAADPNNVLVLQFANVLEQLETEFYAEGISKFQASDITAAGFTSANVVLEQLTAIQSDEATHTTVLQSTLTSLAQTPLNCSFDFSSVLTDVSTMVTVARLVENVGVAAYLGAAHLLSDPTLLTAAASIVTVEARHQTVLNTMSSGQAIPSAFDLPLLPQEVLAIAGAFIQPGCDLGVTANTALKLTNTDPLAAGTQVQFDLSNANTTDTSGLFCQMMAGGMPFSLSQPVDNCMVPSNVTGPVAVWVTKDDQPLANNARDRTDTNVLAGPSVVFIDTTVDTISQLVRTSAGSAASSSSSSSSDSSAQPASTSTIAAAAATSLAAGNNAGADSPEFTPVISMVPKPTTTPSA
ncbi:unnamed protein product [Peniophora sp. CBMAI 1063]|nr:unnamed protein product [Peniophora sp. CBMAI 1063]